MLYQIEHSMNGKMQEQRLAMRRERSRPLIAELEIWMRQQSHPKQAREECPRNTTSSIILPTRS
jgi:hypothetical protein